MQINKLKIVLIGYGRMGKNHYRVLCDNPKVEVVAVIDPKIPAETVLSVPTAKVLSDIEEIKGLHFDAIIIATSTQTHYEICKKAIAFKKPILLEKPLCSTYDQSLDLVRLSEKAGVFLAVGHVERQNPAIKKFKEVVASGILGMPIHCSVTRVGGYPEDVARGNNVLLDLAVHDVDVLQMVFGKFDLHSSIAHCTIRQGIHDTTQITGICDGNVSADIHANWITPTKIRTIRLTGSQGVCFVDYMLQSCTIMGGNMLKRGSGAFLSYEELLELYRATDKLECGVVRQEPLKNQLEEFIAAIRGDPHSLCLALSGAQVVQVAEEALSKATKLVKPMLHNAPPAK